MRSEYSLGWLDQLVTVTLGEENGNLSEQQVEEYKQRAEREKERIRLKLMHQVFSAGEEKKLEVLIPQYQRSLIRLLSVLDKNKTLSFGLKSFIKHLIEELLFFIEHYFIKYFDTEQVVPSSYLKTHKKKWRLWQLEWGVDVEKEEGLYCLVREVGLWFLSAGELSYRQMAYADDLFRLPGTEAVVSSEEPGLFDPLSQLLIYLNFNHSGFVAYLVRQLKKSLEGEGVQEKRAKLLFYQHSVEQQPLKPGRILYERLPSVSYSIGTWVEYQLKCLQPEFNNDMIQTMEKQEADKVHLSVSVAMLGLFVRLLREEEIIVNNNQAELIRFFAAHFTTTRQSIISADSLYGSFYKPQPGTVRMMRDCLARLQNTLHKKF